MNKKKWLIIGGVALASVLLVVAAFAARGTGKDPGALADGSASSVAASDVAGATSSNQTNSVDPATSADGTASGDPAKSSADVDDPAEGAVTIAEPGKPLKRVVKPPEHTLAMLDPNVAKAGTSYEIVFKPYGTGPQSGGLTVAALGVTAKLRDLGAKAPDLAGRNVLLVLSAGEVVEVGGSYRATLTLIERGDTLLPVVSNVHPLD
ncbi:MAG: hypothetical protein Q8K89_02605 [Actinomycetota bacterium]|nr:hypothetical protein [Actinomycetota bacterium]